MRKRLRLLLALAGGNLILLLPLRAQAPQAFIGNVYDAVFGPGNLIYVSASFRATDGEIYQGNIRLTANGSIDATFIAGLANPALSFGLLSDGSFLAGGAAFVTKHSPNGALIGSFGAIFDSRALVVSNDGTTIYTGGGVYSPSGSRLVGFGRNAMDAFALAVQPDGQILLGGTGGSLVRLNRDGTVDPSFNAPPEMVGGTVHGLSVQQDRKIIVAGTGFRSAPNVVRLNANGTIDGTFSAAVGVYGPVLCLSDGTILVSTGNNGTQISIDSWGRIVTAGALVRLNSDGTFHAGQPAVARGFETLAEAGLGVFSLTELIFHSADTDLDRSIDLFEITRVIELYNTRHGTDRTGCYRVDADGEDGFAVDAARPPGTVATLVRYHSADTRGPRTGTSSDGAIDLFELTRVIELYNTRKGTVRTGDYRIQSGTEDGFAAGF